MSLSFGAAKDSENNRNGFIVPAERKIGAIVFGIDHGGELSGTVKKFLEIDYPRSRAARHFANFLALHATGISTNKIQRSNPGTEFRGIL